MASITEGANVSLMKPWKWEGGGMARQCVYVLEAERGRERNMMRGGAGGSWMKNHHQSKCRYCGGLTLCQCHPPFVTVRKPASH